MKFEDKLLNNIVARRNKFIQDLIDLKNNKEQSILSRIEQGIKNWYFNKMKIVSSKFEGNIKGLISDLEKIGDKTADYLSTLKEIDQENPERFFEELNTYFNLNQNTSSYRIDNNNYIVQIEKINEKHKKFLKGLIKYYDKLLNYKNSVDNQYSNEIVYSEYDKEQNKIFEDIKEHFDKYWKKDHIQPQESQITIPFVEKIKNKLHQSTFERSSIKAGIVKLSELENAISNHTHEFKIIARYFYFDKPDLIRPGVNIEINAIKCVFLEDKIHIDLHGNNANDRIGKAASGVGRNSQGDGMSGYAGLNGEAGQKGGDFKIYTAEIINKDGNIPKVINKDDPTKIPKLIIDNHGGNGGRGQDGGDGSNGANGADAGPIYDKMNIIRRTENDLIQIIRDLANGRQPIFCTFNFPDKYKEITTEVDYDKGIYTHNAVTTVAKEGSPARKGGSAGQGGWSGQGGLPGKFVFDMGDGTPYESIECISVSVLDNPGIDGQWGSSGKPGENGKKGSISFRDLNDYRINWGAFTSLTISMKGSASILEAGDGIFKFADEIYSDKLNENSGFLTKGIHFIGKSIAGTVVKAVGVGTSAVGLVTGAGTAAYNVGSTGILLTTAIPSILQQIVRCECEPWDSETYYDKPGYNYTFGESYDPGVATQSLLIGATGALFYNI